MVSHPEYPDTMMALERSKYNRVLTALGVGGDDDGKKWTRTMPDPYND
jgi:hypothetical protein